MKYLLIFCFYLITSCKDPEQKTSPTTTETPAPRPSLTESTLHHIFDVGLAHFLERQLDGFELKAAIINHFHSLLFYYNKDTEQVCFYLDENLIYLDRKNTIFQVNGKNIPNQIVYYIPDKERILIPIDFSEMTEDQRKNFKPPGMKLAYGFKLKQTDSFNFSISLTNQRDKHQDVKVSYDPNKGWNSSASEIKNEHNLIEANVFCFGKEKVIDQMKRINKDAETCIIRTKTFPYQQYTIPLTFDSDYDKLNTYPIEIEIKQDKMLINGEESTFYKLKVILKEKLNPLSPIHIRFTLSDTSHEQTVRDLFAHLTVHHLPHNSSSPPEAKCFIGFK
ncbi:MAG: hypothetical protein ACSHX6_09495 [Akkermansiaceae bacterium]